MSNSNLARRTRVRLLFNQVEITQDINEYFVSLSYTDSEGGEADDLQITLADADNIWAGSWLADELENRDVTSKEASRGNRYKVTAQSGLRVRSGPGLASKILGALSHGTDIQVQEITDGWAKTEYNGQTGYVSADYIKEDGGKQAAGISSQEGKACKRAELHAVIVAENWNGDGTDEVLDCGVFELDSVDLSGPPQVIRLSGTSLAYSSAIRQAERSKAWENMKLSAIAQEIAENGGYTLMYLAQENPLYERREQIAQSDIVFLEGLCEAAGIALKSADKMLVLYDCAAFESKEAAHVISRGDGSYITFRFATSLAQTAYSACEVSYTNPDTGEVISHTFQAPAVPYDEANILKVNEAVGSVEEAEGLAKKRLREKNKGETTGVFVMPGNPLLAAGMTVEAREFGVYSGKYLIESAKHSIDKINGYRTTLTVRYTIEGY